MFKGGPFPSQMTEWNFLKYSSGLSYHSYELNVGTWKGGHFLNSLSVCSVCRSVSPSIFFPRIHRQTNKRVDKMLRNLLLNNPIRFPQSMHQIYSDNIYILRVFIVAQAPITKIHQLFGQSVSQSVSQPITHFGDPFELGFVLLSFRPRWIFFFVFKIFCMNFGVLHVFSRTDAQVENPEWSLFLWTLLRILLSSLFDAFVPNTFFSADHVVIPR